MGVLRAILEELPSTGISLEAYGRTGDCTRVLNGDQLLRAISICRRMIQKWPEPEDGRRVAAMLFRSDETLDLMVASLAALQEGWIVTPLFPNWPHESQEEYLEIYKLRWMLVGPGFADRAEGWLGSFLDQSLLVDLGEILPKTAAEEPLSLQRLDEIPSEQACAWIFTSGTSKRLAKLTEITYGNIEAAIHNIGKIPWVEQNKAFHNPLSASHIFSFALIFGLLAVRPSRMIFSDIQFLPRLPLSRLGKVYAVILVPVVVHRMRAAFYQKLTADLDPKTAPPELMKLARIPKRVRFWLKDRALQAENEVIARETGESGSWSGRVSIKIVNKVFGPMLRDRLADPDVAVLGGAKAGDKDMAFLEVMGIRCLQGWGMTETTGALCVADRYDHDGAFGKCGPFFPGTKAYTVDGELVIEGPQVARGYYDPEGGFTPFNGKVFTGDYAEVDEQNRLKILGKVSDRITTVNGLNYNPLPFEEEIQALDLDRQSQLDEVIVIGDGQPRLGAVFFLRPEADLNGQMEVYLKQLLRDFNATRHIDERIDRWTVADGQFQQAGLLGPSGKLLRRVAEQNYASIFDA